MDWALPKEILALIFLNLSCNDVFKALSINKYWNEMRNYESLWKDLAFSGAFPHYYQRSDNENWRNIVRNFVETRKNLIAGRFTLETIAARAPAVDNWGKDIFPAKCSVYDKYCLIVWNSIERREDTRGFDAFHETELWDLESKQKIKNYAQPMLRFFGSYVVSGPISGDALPYGDVTLEHAPFDLNNDLQFKQFVAPNATRQLIELKENYDARSSLVVVHNIQYHNKCAITSVLDLSTGKTVFEKTLPIPYSAEICGNDLFLRDQGDERAKRIDVIRGTKDKVYAVNVITTYEEMISVDEQHIYRYNLRTKEEKKILIEPGLNMNPLFVYHIYLVNGVIALLINQKFWFIDPNDGSYLNCITVVGSGNPNMMQAYNGKFVMSNEGNSVSVLSFRDEDVYRPIEILEVSTTGETKVHKLIHGLLYEKFSSLLSYSSLLVHETADERYSLVHVVEPKDDVRHNQFATKLLQQGKVKTPNHKAITIQRVLGPLSGRYVPYTRLSMSAYGDCFVIYERIIDGKWKVTTPADQWLIIRDKLMQ